MIATIVIAVACAQMNAAAQRGVRLMSTAMIAMTIAITRAGAINTMMTTFLRATCVAPAVVVTRPVLPRSARLRRRRAAKRALTTRATSCRRHIRAPSLRTPTAVIAAAASAQTFVGKPARGNRANIGRTLRVTPVPSSRMIMVATVLVVAAVVPQRQQSHRRRLQSAQ